MAKRIIYIVVGALLVFGLLFLLWSWFFSGSTNTAQNTGTFGAASSTSGAQGASGQATNGQTTVGGSAATNGVSGANGTVALGGGLSNIGTNSGSSNGGAAGSSGNTTNTNTGSGTSFNTGTVGVAGVDWLGGANASIGTGGAGSGFTPTAINSVNGSGGGSVPTILSTTNSNGTGLNLGTALLGVTIAGTVSCTIQSFGLAGLGIAGGSVAISTGATAASAAAGVPVTDITTHAQLTAITGLQTSQTTQQTSNTTNKFLACITNTIAKAALQQITVSIVNWINSGFNGSPAFVTNFQQFFTNVADLAAGQFIQGAGLSFLCSPFAPQIKIALAQSYANRNAQSCTLTKVINDVNAFMNGQWSQGGWPGLISFTTVPTNNPYGAFAYAQIGLANAQTTALNNAKNNISPTGFLNLQQITCTNGQNTIQATAGLAGSSQAASAAGVLPSGCKASVTTPGTIIQNSLTSANDTTLKQLGLGNSIDQIINALMTQLVIKTLYNGLTSITAATTIDTTSQSQDAALLADMQNNINIAQQLGSIDQGSIGDIENAQSQLSTLQNCWSGIAASTASSTTSGIITEALANASTASSTLITLNNQIAPYNNDITNINNEIALLEQFVAQATSVASAADVQALTTSYNTTKSSTTFISTTDLTTAQQNRTTLQSNLAALNQTTQGSLAQCQALTPH